MSGSLVFVSWGWGGGGEWGKIRWGVWRETGGGKESPSEAYPNRAASERAVFLCISTHSHTHSFIRFSHSANVC